MDPSIEHINALTGKPFQAFPGQDHRAHMTAHLNFMATNMARNNPKLWQVYKKIFWNTSIMAQEQIELEFREQMLQMQQMQMQATTDPMMMQQQLQSLTNEIEARKSVLIAEMTEEFMKEEKKITSQFDSDLF